MRTAVKAWQAGNTLFLAFPSQSNPGTIYPVMIRETAGRLVIEHLCPARAGCWHEKEAARLYREWRWWKETPQKVVSVRRPVVLRLEQWMEIAIPGTVPELVSA